MTDLITRIEAAKEPRQELFEEAFQALGNELFLWERDYQHPNTTAFLKWRRFDMMLDAEAWTSAAEMLVPEGWRWRIMPGDCGKNWLSEVWTDETLDSEFASRAAHPSLALLAAFLRAERKDDEL